MTSLSKLGSLSASFLVLLGCGSGGFSRAAPRGTVLTAPSLGTAGAFSVLGGQTVTNTGPTTLSGDLGVSPGTAITGFPPGIVTPPGKTHKADAVALQAQADVGSSYDVLAGDPCTSNLSGQDLGGLTLTPGVYCFSSEAMLTGTLVLDAKFEANAAFVFQIVSKLTAASGASVRLINGASACNVYWQVGSSATIGTAASFSGNILALTSIALQTGASLSGRALARNGAVTLDNNLIRSDTCAAAGGGTDGGLATLSCCFGAVECNGACVDLKTDANDCGACGKHCAVNQVCHAGACTACPHGNAQCTDQCADLQSDPFNCGACGKVCAGNQSCTAGVCGACEATVCANTCVQTNSDHANCGACGNTCAADQCCNGGVCGTTGPMGYCKLH